MLNEFCWCRYVTASVYQMLRGAEILFSAIFAVIFLKRSLNKFHYCGIAGCLVGICMVGASSLLSPSGGGSSDTGMVLLGMGLIVVAQVRPSCASKLQHSAFHQCDCVPGRLWHASPAHALSRECPGHWSQRP